MQYWDDNCYVPTGNGCFFKGINYIFKKDFRMEFFEFKQSYKRRSRYRIPEFCERYKIDIGLYNLNSEKILPGYVKQRDKSL